MRRRQHEGRRCCLRVVGSETSTCIFHFGRTRCPGLQVQVDSVVLNTPPYCKCIFLEILHTPLINVCGPSSVSVIIWWLEHEQAHEPYVEHHRTWWLASRERCTTDLYDCSVWSSTGNPHNSLHYKNIYVFFLIITHTEKSGAESLTIINNWNIVWIKKASLVLLSKEHLFILYYNSAWKASPLLCSPDAF